MLIVVDVQNDFCTNGALAAHDTDSLLAPLNQLIRYAMANGIGVVFTRDWHPENHSSFKSSNGIWDTHCVQDTPGAEFHPRLWMPESPSIIDKGVASEGNGYSPYDDASMHDHVRDVSNIYVAGIALEFCVKDTCLHSLEHYPDSRVTCFKNVVRSITDQQDDLSRNGVVVRDTFQEALPIRRSTDMA